MSKLIAKVNIFYKGKQYIPGEEVPDDNADMVEAWKRAESVTEAAEQKKEETEAPENAESQEETESQEVVQKAKSVTAQPGIPAEGANEEDVIGKVPSRRKTK